MVKTLPSRRLVAARGQIALVSGGRYQQPAGVHPVPFRIPPGRVIVELGLGGKGWVRHAGAWHDVDPGDLLWHRAGEETIARSDFERPYLCLALALHVPARFSAHPPRIHRGIDPSAARDFAREVTQALTEDEPDRELVRDFVIARLALWIRQCETRARRRALPAPLQEVLAWIEAHHAERCGLPELARVAGWSSAHLHAVFRAHLGVTPHRWVLDLRLRSARARLAGTLDPIKRIAVECGFADSSAFIHVFRKATGVTPAIYRRHQREVLAGTRTGKLT